MPSNNRESINWNQLQKWFIGLIFFLDLLLIYTWISDYFLVDLLKPYDDKAQALLGMIFIISGFLIVIAPVYMYRQIRKRGKN